MTNGAIFIGRGGIFNGSSVTSATPTLPSVQNANGLLICHVSSYNNGVHTCSTTGWFKFGQQNNGSGFTSSIFYAREGVGAPTITWTGAANAQAVIIYYNDANAIIGDIGANTVNPGAGSSHSSLSLNTTRANSLVVLVDTANITSFMSGSPSGWINDIDIGGTSEFTKKLNISGSSSNNTTVSQQGSNNSLWVEWQLEVREALPTDGLQASELETSAIFTPRTGLDASELQSGVIFTPRTGLDASEIETFIIIRPGTTPTTTWIPRIIHI
jgi:hypothetical protein